MRIASWSWTRGESCRKEPSRNSPQSRASSRSCWPGRPELVLLVARVGGGDLRGGILVALRGHGDLLHLHDLVVRRLLALRRDDDRAHLLHFLAAGDAVELLVGELAFVANGFRIIFGH